MASRDIYFSNIAQTQGEDEMTSATDLDRERQVLEAEERRRAALVANDLDTLSQILGDDLTYVHSSAAQDTKASFIESLRTGRFRYEAMEMADLAARVYGDTAVVTGRFVARVVLQDGSVVTPKPRVLMVYTLRDGRWQMVAWQSTNIPGA
jgi:ketosteroid isomerase-like protein